MNHFTKGSNRRVKFSGGRPHRRFCLPELQAALDFFPGAGGRGLFQGLLDLGLGFLPGLHGLGCFLGRRALRLARRGDRFIQN
jgi:hypothetical protein